MDALKSLYDSQVSEDEAVEVLQCSQQYHEAIDLDEGAFRVVNVAPIDHEAPRRTQDIVPGKLPNLLAVDLLNAFSAAPRQLAEEPEAAQIAVIQAITPVEGIVPDDERKVRPLYHRMIGRSRSRSTGRSEVPEVEV